jgi:hypothetical protein
MKYQYNPPCPKKFKVQLFARKVMMSVWGGDAKGIIPIDFMKARTTVI